MPSSFWLVVFGYRKYGNSCVVLLCLRCLCSSAAVALWLAAVYIGATERSAPPASSGSFGSLSCCSMLAVTGGTALRAAAGDPGSRSSTRSTNSSNRSSSSGSSALLRPSPWPVGPPVGAAGPVSASPASANCPQRQQQTPKTHAERWGSRRQRQPRYTGNKKAP